MSTLYGLANRWKEEAVRLQERYGEPGKARILLLAADELLVALKEVDDDILNLQQAAEASGYSPDYLGKLVREDKIPNAGRRNAPRIRRSDLPLRAGLRAPIRVNPYDGDVMQIVQSVVASN